jgi:hypothetical protein
VELPAILARQIGEDYRPTARDERAAALIEVDGNIWATGAGLRG